MQNGEQRQQASGPVTTLLPPPKALDTTGDVWRSWKTWRQEFELFATATYLNQQPKEVQAATFLMIIGEDARKTYSTLDFATDEEKSDVEVLKMKFEAFYKPALNLAYHEFRFGKCDQKDGESFNDWLTDLRVLAKSCEFGQLEERMLRSRIILGIRDKKLQEKLISENASFTKTVEMCRSREHGKEQCEEIQARPKSDYAAEMNALSEAKGQRCTKCAKVHQTDRVCPAKGRTCRKCGGRNHFAIACKKMQKRFHSKEHAVASVDAEEGDFWLETLSHARGKDDRWTATVEIEGKPIFCKLDTGATCSVIARSQLQKITNKQPLDCNVVLNTFFGFQKKATKQVRLEVATRESKILTEFFVVDDEIAVTLSGTVAEELGLLQRVCSVDQIELYGTAKPYEDVFEGLGQLEGIVYHLKLKPGSQGVVKPARRIPIALQSKVKAELDRMETAGVIVKVTEPTEWASNMVVVTKGEKVRICLDPSDLNKALLREHYPMPTLEDIAPSISGAQYFTTLDAASGFWQIKLDKESSKICTMCTPYGRYRFLRMPFGISSAPEIFQRAMHRVLEGLEGVAVVMDDILVWGRSREQHDANLEHVLRRCREYKLKLNRKKCRFLQESVRYLGHILTRDGLSLDPQRLEDILQVQTPSNQKELQTFLGMVNFVSRFIPNMSDLTAPLRELLKKNVAWLWEDRQDASFKALKEALATAPVLSYYEKGKPIRLSVDASQNGVGAVIIQDGHPLAYSSRSLTETQQRYAQIEKEMLAIVHGCERFRDYLFGQPEVVVESDHKPLEIIFKKPLCQCPLRLQRMRLSLQRYPIVVKYTPGKQLFVADALSRSPSQAILKEQCLNYQLNTIACLQVSDRRLSQVLQETDQDPVMVKLRQYASSQWPESKADVSSELRCYWSFRDELHTQDGLVFRSNRLIIPAKMRSEVLACLHAAHGGAEKMKARARAVLFWPSINSDLEEVARRCETCQKHKPRNRRLPLMNHEIPSLPWEVVGADICYHNATEYLVVVDFYSFFFEIRPVKTTADKVIAAFADIFATHGFPQRLCTDNGPPFSSQDFREFVGKISLHHVRSSPYHPRSNGMAERAVQEAKKLLKRYRYGTVDFCAALLEWRNTPRDSYLKSPMQRLMGRNARTLLPVTETHLRPQTIPPEEVQRRLHVIRSRQRSFYNRGTRPLPGLPEGSRVTVYNVPSKTWSPATVVKPANSPRAYIVETEDGLQLQRTREHLRLAPTPLVPPTQEHQADVGPAEPQLRRSERNRRPPQRYPMPEL